MRMPWNKSKGVQLDLLDAPAVADVVSPRQPAMTSDAGQPLMLPVTSLYEDPNNPRTEVPDAELDELAEDIRQHGILQAIVAHPVDAEGLYRIHFGAKRWRAAQRIGLHEVPVVIRAAPADPYTQVAENQKRHGLTPLDLARFIRGRVDAGDSNATIAKRLGMNLTTVAHHLALLELPPELEEALKSGRCTSPRTLHELSKLHEEQPDQVHALIAGDAEITRAAVSAMRAERTATAPRAPAPSRSTPIAQAHAACDRLEHALSRIDAATAHRADPADLVGLRARIVNLASRWSQGSDRQTPSQAKR
jgi:ParB family transcriptional regulator, chromosome partitioning protein